jgi:hypothetical protein
MNAFTVMIQCYYRSIVHHGMVGGPGFRDRPVSAVEQQCYLNLLSQELWHWLYENGLDPAVWVYWNRTIDKIAVIDEYVAHFDFETDADACLFKLFWGN